MTDSSDAWRTIGWNGLSLSSPKSWQTIVSGDRHLLFEEHFQPVFELRWQKEDKNSTTAILRKLARTTELLPHKAIPASWKRLKECYTIQMLGENRKESPTAALLTCKQCGTVLLCYFFRELAGHQSDFRQILSSLRCHGPEGEERLWAVQDFQVRLPADFQLSSHSFRAGFTRLSFSSSGLTMHLCRLASAARRLEEATLTDLMLVLGDIQVPEEEIRQELCSAGHANHPSITNQIMSRLKRRSPFHWMILRHHPQLDRLSGLFFFDKKPFFEEMISAIVDSYELFPL